MENNQKGAAPESPMRGKSQKCLSLKETLVTTGGNFFFNGSGQAGFRDFEAMSLQGVYSVIRDGKLPIIEGRGDVPQQSPSLIDEFKLLAASAAKAEAAKEVLLALEKQASTEELPAGQEPSLLTKAKEDHTRLKKAYDQQKKYC